MHKLLASAVLASASLAAQPADWVRGVLGFRVETLASGSAAAHAGLQVGDVITAIQGKPITTLEDLRKSLLGSPSLSVDYTRLELKEEKLEKGKATLPSPAAVEVSPDEPWELSEGCKGRVGLLVTEIVPGSLAARAELKAGDVIFKINDTSLQSRDELRIVQESYDTGTQVQIYFWRYIPSDQRHRILASRRKFVR